MAASFQTALIRKANVMRAVMLRDMRTRFFDHGLGFLVVVFFPLGHMMVLLGIYSALGRAAPYGDSLLLFFGTGLVPTLSFIYTSRMMVISLIANKPMLAFPAVKVTDVIFGRAVLEIMAACLMTLFVIIIFGFLGEPVLPISTIDAVSAVAAVLLLAVGIGFLVSLIAAILPAAAVGYTLTSILLYLLSGTIFVPSSLPEPVIALLAWNPVLHSVEWLRTAYYLDYPQQVLDRTYLLMWGFGSLFGALVLERFSRPYVM